MLSFCFRSVHLPWCTPLFPETEKSCFLFKRRLCCHILKLDLGSVIYPRYITSEAIIAYVRAKKNSTNSNIETLYHMFDNRAEAIEFCVDEPSSVTGIPLKDLMLKNDLLVSFIYRNGKVQIPSGLDTIEVGDTVMIVTTHTGLDNIQDIIRS